MNPTYEKSGHTQPINPYYYDDWEVTDIYSTDGWSFEISNDEYLLRWDDYSRTVIVRPEESSKEVIKHSNGIKFTVDEPYVYLKLHAIIDGIEIIYPFVDRSL